MQLGNKSSFFCRLWIWRQQGPAQGVEQHLRRLRAADAVAAGENKEGHAGDSHALRALNLGEVTILDADGKPVAKK